MDKAAIKRAIKNLMLGRKSSDDETTEQLPELPNKDKILIVLHKKSNEEEEVEEEVEEEEVEMSKPVVPHEKWRSFEDQEVSHSTPIQRIRRRRPE